MKKIITLVVVLAMLGWFARGPLIDLAADYHYFPSDDARPRLYGVDVERELGFVTEDGVFLSADVYRPSGLEKAPTILIRIPYNRSFENDIKVSMISRYFAGRGYVTVLQSARGRAKSGGIFYPLKHEKADGFETLDWLKQQDWYDGRLGMWGASAYAQTEWVLADEETDIDVFFIQIASTQFKELFHVNGAFALETALFWTIRNEEPDPTEVKGPRFEKGLNTLPISQADDVGFVDTDYYNDWLANGLDSDYWGIIDGENRAKNISAPVLFLGGWYDPFLASQMRDYHAVINEAKPEIAKETRLIIGPWAHPNAVKTPDMKEEIEYRASVVIPAIPWFDYHLGLSDTLDMPKVRLFVMGDNDWRNESEWPIARAQQTTYYLNSNGRANSATGDGVLSLKMTSELTPMDAYNYDPNNPVPTAGGSLLGNRAGMKKQNELEKRQDVLVYSSDVLSERIEVTGEIIVELYVSTDAPSTDFTAKLVDVYPDGNAYNLTSTILRRSYSQGASDVDKVHKIILRLPPTSNAFHKGHTIRLEISSSDFPHFDRNANTGREFDSAENSRIAKQKIYHSAQYPSRIVLPIIPIKN
ncbi:MAG: CocE/NonD family hydrolase [Gammaproteobacteria bacterium]|nr:CocE/NonD family hydrolase [Gammaproteobacteria bacterium]